ncbi:MAG: hypothetical protein SLAVMIC_00581 [uncultured marine phage]|uniref:Uncharacterized protein n=1 Tax=uncultured marine phage TaxID=707152 RepID=A0A8D9CEG2_9VIRU|nr:MAG: hypothetical protein SLAVMIC_00581 [uncultured marine phage]
MKDDKFRKEVMLEMMSKFTERDHKDFTCDYCGGYMDGNAQMDLDYKTIVDNHYEKCKVKIREDRINKLLDKDE